MSLLSVFTSKFSKPELPRTKSRDLLAEIITPESALLDDINIKLYAGTKLRYSTCSGVAWVPGKLEFVTVNLEKASLNHYKFDHIQFELKHLNQIILTPEMGMHRPENLAFNPEKNEVAIVTTKSKGRPGGTFIFETDSEDIIQPNTGNKVSESIDTRCHGIAYSPTGRFAAYTTVDDPGRICVLRIDDQHTEITYVLKNAHEPLKPKSLVFSNCGSFLIVAFCNRIGESKRWKAMARLEVYSFDSSSGRIDPRPIESYGENGEIISLESLAIGKSSSTVFATDQVNNIVTAHTLNADGKFTNHWVDIFGGKGGLSFPHGIGISHDDKYIAVTSYGDDKVSVFAYC